ncbi:MAG: RluA family pseudouridine synthase [Fibrobacterota bacterium]
MIFSSTVPCNTPAGTSAAVYLARRFTYYSLEEWQEKINQNKIFINGRLCGPGDCVRRGDTVSYDAGEFREPEADLSYRIVYEDEWILGICKPGNLLVHRAGKCFRNNLIYQLRFVHDPPFPESHIVHRLDRETSGTVIVAKDSTQSSVFGKLFLEGRVEKRYKAVVRGSFDIETPYVIDCPIAQDCSSGIQYRHRVHKSGKPAITRIEHAEPCGDEHSFLELVPVTGRTHQLRVHLSSIGFPIAGDRLYGMSAEEYLANGNRGYCCESPDISRQALHCESLSFLHPHTGTRTVIRADLPGDMKAFAEKCREPRRFRSKKNGIHK